MRRQRMFRLRHGGIYIYMYYRGGPSAINILTILGTTQCTQPSGIKLLLFSRNVIAYPRVYVRVLIRMYV